MPRTGLSKEEIIVTVLVLAITRAAYATSVLEPEKLKTVVRYLIRRA